MRSRLLVVCLALGVVGTSLACSRNPDRVKRAYLESGNRYFDEHKYPEAIIEYKNALQQDPLFGEAHVKLAECYRIKGDIGGAAHEYVRAADALPEDLDVQVNAASFLVLVGQFEESKARAQKILKRSPKNFQAQLILADSLAGLKDFRTAMKEFQEAVDLEPSSASARQSLAMTQLALGQQKEAADAFAKAVEMAPQSPQAYLSLASFQWITGQLPDAERSLTKVLELDPKNALAHRGLATLFVATGRMPEAESHLRALADQDTSPGATDRLSLADYYISMNRLDAAVQVLEPLTKQGDAAAAAATRAAAIKYVRDGAAEGNRAIDEVLAKHPHSTVALVLKSRFRVAEGHLDEALKFAQSAVQSDPQSVPARYLEGTIYRALKQPAKAAESFGEVLRLNPRATPAQIQLAELNLQQGKAAAAVQLADEAARRVPGDQAIQLTLLRTLMANGQLDRANSVAHDLLAKNPNAAVLHDASAQISLARGDRGSARKSFARALELQKSDLQAVEGLARLDLADRNPVAAKARLDDVLSRAPKNPAVALLAARVYGASGDTARAEQKLRDAIQLDPSALDPYILLGELYGSQHRLAEARQTFQSILKMQPDSVPINTIVGILYSFEGNRAEAKRQYERVLKIDPHATAAANNLAFIYADEGGNLDMALQLAQSAKQKLPTSPEVADTIGWVYVKKSMPSLAVQQLQQAADGAPNNAMIQYHLGVALTKSGDVVRGRQALQRALKLNLAPAAADDARRLLAERNS
jgi:putative PEP-CTERM system TPR-repeat lipoprotein